MTTTTRASRDPLAFLADELAELRRAHLYRPLRIVSSMQGPECVVDGRTVISLASNDYLGLTHHPRMIRAAAEAAQGQMTAYVSRWIEERRANPGDDLISWIVHANIADRPINEEETFGLVRLVQVEERVDVGEVDAEGVPVRSLSMETGFWRPQEDGTVEVLLSGIDYGQGLMTVAAQFAAERRIIGSLIGGHNQREAVMSDFEKRAPAYIDAK